MQLTEHVAVVTGASGGIGGAISRSLAGDGYRVCGVGRNEDRLASLREELRAAADGSTTYIADLTRVADVERLTERILGDFGRVDVLVHSAGTIHHGRLDESPLELLDQQYFANVRGPLLLTQLLLPSLKQQQGQIVFINSSVGLMARPHAGQFSATQHAFRALADALRDEVNEQGIRVLSVYPGRTATQRIKELHAQEGRPYAPEKLLQPEDIASVVRNSLALPRTAEVTNIQIRPMLKSY